MANQGQTVAVFNARAACRHGQAQQGNAALLMRLPVPAVGMLALSCSLAQYSAYVFREGKVTRFVETPEPNSAVEGDALQALPARALHRER